MDALPGDSSTHPVLFTAPRGGGKTRWLIGRVRERLDAGVPARRMLVVAFSPRATVQIAAHLPAEADTEEQGGLRVRTAQRLCAALWREYGQPDERRIFSSVERALLIHAAARSLGPDHPLRAERIGAGGLAEIESLLEAITAQGGRPDDLAALASTLPTTLSHLDRAALDDIARLYRRYRSLCRQAGGVTYQELAARVAALLADPAVAEPLAAGIDYLFVDGLERAEPAQLEVLARLGARAQLAATLDPSGLIGEQGRRVAQAARNLLGLEVPSPPAPWDASPLPVRGRGETRSAASAPSLHLRERGWGGEGILLSEQPLDTAEAAYVARQTRLALTRSSEVRQVDEQGEGEPEVLILAPVPALRASLLAALREAGVAEAVDAAAVDESYDPAVRYALAWLRAVVDPGDEQWERVLASPHARLPAAELSRLRHWATGPGRGQQPRRLVAALREAAHGGCEALGDAARLRLTEIAALLDELHRSVERGEAPGVTLHRLLAREDVVGALLVGPTDTGAAPPDPRGLAGLCALMARLEALWRQAYGEQPTLAPFLDRLEQSLSHLHDHAAPPLTGRVVVANLEDAADWRARTVIIPGLCDAFLPRPRAQSRLLSEAALAHLRARWTLPWPVDAEEYKQGERRLFDQGAAAARARLVLTRARRYDGVEAPAPSPLLLDWLGFSEINATRCQAAGVSYDVAPRQASDLGVLNPVEAARDLPLLLYRHAHALKQTSVEAAEDFLAAARETLAEANAPAPARLLTLDDPFAPLAPGPCAVPLRSSLGAGALKDFLYCPRRFFYTTQAGIEPPERPYLPFGQAVGRVVAALHNLHPSLADVSDEEVEEAVRAVWEGDDMIEEGAPGGEMERGFAARFGSPVQAAAALARVHGLVRRLAASKAHPTFSQRTAATGARAELPVALPSGRTVRLTAPIDRVAVRRDGAAETLALIDYRSGASSASENELIKEFLNRAGEPEWRPSDYTLPVMFLGVAGNRAFYTAHGLRPLKVRHLTVVSLGKERDGRPAYRTIDIQEGDNGALEQSGAVTVAELRGLRDEITGAVVAAAAAPYRPMPARAFNPCRDCAHRFACPGPEVEE